MHHAHEIVENSSNDVRVLHLTICGFRYSNVLLASLNARVILRSSSQTSNAVINVGQRSALWQDNEVAPPSTQLGPLQFTRVTMTTTRDIITEVSKSLFPPENICPYLHWNHRRKKIATLCTRKSWSLARNNWSG